MIDSNNNDTEIPEDLPEEQAFTTEGEGFSHADQRQMQNRKEEEPVDHSPSIIPMKERKWIDIEPGKLLSLSLRTRFRRK